MKRVKKEVGVVTTAATARKPIAITVVPRRSTPQEQRQQEAALKVLLTEWVRQRLGRERNV